MTADPVWFGRAERPLHGWIHRPAAGVARGAIVVCPPVGLDLSYADSNLRVLARNLEELGFVVVRFDYDGTGQSAGDMADRDRLSSWVESVREAVALAREAGPSWVGAIGLRLGATLAAQVASTDSFDALVLWDPYLSGTAFLREQSAVKLGVLPQLTEKAQGLSGPGYVFPSEAVAELQQLELPSASEMQAGKLLMLTDPKRRPDRRLTERLTEPRAEWQEYCEVSELFDTGRLDYQEPRALLDQVASWIDEACDCDPGPLAPRNASPATAVVARSDDGFALVEEHVTLGPVGLFGIACARIEPGAEGGSREQPTVLFLSMAQESSIGPARQWVEYARRLALEGVRSVRFDFSSVGESPTRPGQEERALYSPLALDDIEDAAQAVSPENPRNVLLVGVCSGAYAALSAAPRVHPLAVVAVNPIMTEWGLEPALATEARLSDPAAAPKRRSLKAAIRSGMRGSGLRTSIAAHLPPSLWRVVFALGLSHSPARLLTPVSKEHVPTLLICGEEEAQAPKTRTPKAVRKLEADGISRFEELHDLNHSLLHLTNREAVFALMSGFLRDPALGVLKPTRRESGSAKARARAASRVRAAGVPGR